MPETHIPIKGNKESTKALFPAGHGVKLPPGQYEYKMATVNGVRGFLLYNILQDAEPTMKKSKKLFLPIKAAPVFESESNVESGSSEKSGSVIESVSSLDTSSTMESESRGKCVGDDDDGFSEALKNSAFLQALESGEGSPVATEEVAINSVIDNETSDVNIWRMRGNVENNEVTVSDEKCDNQSCQTSRDVEDADVIVGDSNYVSLCMQPEELYKHPSHQEFVERISVPKSLIRDNKEDLERIKQPVPLECFANVQGVSLIGKSQSIITPPLPPLNRKFSSFAGSDDTNIKGSVVSSSPRLDTSAVYTQSILSKASVAASHVTASGTVSINTNDMLISSVATTAPTNSIVICRSNRIASTIINTTSSGVKVCNKQSPGVSQIGAATFAGTIYTSARNHRQDQGRDTMTVTTNPTSSGPGSSSEPLKSIKHLLNKFSLADKTAQSHQLHVQCSNTQAASQVIPSLASSKPNNPSSDVRVTQSILCIPNLLLRGCPTPRSQSFNICDKNPPKHLALSNNLSTGLNVRPSTQSLNVPFSVRLPVLPPNPNRINILSTTTARQKMLLYRLPSESGRAIQILVPVGSCNSVSGSQTRPKATSPLSTFVKTVTAMTTAPLSVALTSTAAICVASLVHRTETICALAPSDAVVKTVLSTSKSLPQAAKTIGIIRPRIEPVAGSVNATQVYSACQPIVVGPPQNSINNKTIVSLSSLGRIMKCKPVFTGQAVSPLVTNTSYAQLHNGAGVHVPNRNHRSLLGHLITKDNTSSCLETTSTDTSTERSLSSEKSAFPGTSSVISPRTAMYIDAGAAKTPSVTADNNDDSSELGIKITSVFSLSDTQKRPRWIGQSSGSNTTQTELEDSEEEVQHYAAFPPPQYGCQGKNSAFVVLEQMNLNGWEINVRHLRRLKRRRKCDILCRTAALHLMCHKSELYPKPITTALSKKRKLFHDSIAGHRFKGERPAKVVKLVEENGNYRETSNDNIKTIEHIDNTTVKYQIFVVKAGDKKLVIPSRQNINYPRSYLMNEEMGPICKRRLYHLVNYHNQALKRDSKKNAKIEILDAKLVFSLFSTASIFGRLMPSDKKMERNQVVVKHLSNCAFNTTPTDYNDYLLDALVGAASENDAEETGCTMSRSAGVADHFVGAASENDAKQTDCTVSSQTAPDGVSASYRESDVTYETCTSNDKERSILQSKTSMEKTAITDHRTVLDVSRDFASLENVNQLVTCEMQHDTSGQNNVTEQDEDSRTDSVTSGCDMDTTDVNVYETVDNLRALLQQQERELEILRSQINSHAVNLDNLDL